MLTEETKANLLFSSNSIQDYENRLFKGRDVLSKIMKHIVEVLD